ncbi:MAG: 5-oxoprolinase subunit PxpB [Woeseiaceae bacterium]
MLSPEYCSDDTLRVALDDRHNRSAIAEHLRSSAVWVDCVEGMRSVVVQFDPSSISHVAAMLELKEQLASVPATTSTPSRTVEVPVCYGGEYGPELASIAEMLGVDEASVVELHTSREHVVELIGFTPGFAYVSGLQEDIKVPRLTEPRQRVEPGSVGVAGGLTGMYALAGPGGWPLIGRTPLALFRADETQPMLLSSGTRIRFVAIDEKTFSQMVAP